MKKQSTVSISSARIFQVGSFTVATLDGGDPSTSLYFLKESALQNLAGGDLTSRVSAGDFTEIWGVFLGGYNWSVNSKQFKKLERIAKQRGGARTGAGAPKKRPTSTITFRVPDHHREVLKLKIREFLAELEKVDPAPSL